MWRWRASAGQSAEHEQRRCPHTRGRWAVVGVLLVVWACASFTLQRVNIHLLDAAFNHLRHSRTGAPTS